MSASSDDDSPNVSPLPMRRRAVDDKGDGVVHDDGELITLRPHDHELPEAPLPASLDSASDSDSVSSEHGAAAPFDDGDAVPLHRSTGTLLRGKVRRRFAPRA